MNNSRFIALFLCLIFGFLSISCGSGRVLSGGELKSDVSAKSLIKSHYENSLDFETIRGRIKAEYSDEHASQAVNVSLRMEKDKAIWLSAAFNVVKVLITPERVSFYNKLDNTYFDGDFSYLNKLLGTELNFEMVQNLLLGQAIENLKNGKYEAGIYQESYMLKPVRDGNLYKLLFLLEPEHFKMALQQLSQPEKGRILNIAYKNYQLTGGKIMPYQISITALEKEQKTNIDIEYKNIEFDQKVTFPYDIPGGYKQIELEGHE